ncbi:LysR family transcriptional regulator [Pelagibius litoralis]|uniref:LysR family transcriptional regulator n=2 Tax=Pelagibius litoralis TaxID=374515 RepID=A0A967EVC9_9PROT|nr:LysR family transcriptional regulator [Pelagibius litoralis]
MNKLGKALPPLACLLPFEAAARLGSFTLAAEELHVTQAAVSRQIRALEEDLGVRLFERRHRAVFLTPAGEDFSRRVSASLETIAAGAGELRGQRRGGEVILFAELCYAFYWLMPRLCAFNQQHPRIDVRVTASTRPVGLSDDDFDIALQTTGRASGAHLLAFTASDEVFPVCSPDYLEGRRSPLLLKDLPDHRLLHHRVDPQDWLEWDEWLEKAGQKVRVGHRGSVFDSYPVMVQAVVGGHGIGLGWQRSTDQLLESGQLVRPFKESVFRKAELSIYRNRKHKLRPETKALLTWLKEELT